MPMYTTAIFNIFVMAIDQETFAYASQLGAPAFLFKPPDVQTYHGVSSISLLLSAAADFRPNYFWGSSPLSLSLSLVNMLSMHEA